MKIDEITKLKMTFSEVEANEFLAKGYRIVKIFSSKRKTEGDNFEEIMPCFVLGLKKENS